MKSVLKFTMLGMVLCSAAAQGQNPANGKALFLKQQCSNCHGTDGQGGAGARLAPNPLPVAAMQKYVRNPTGAMPPYTNQVSDADIADIRAYLATVPAPPAVKDIPLLNR